MQYVAAPPANLTFLNQKETYKKFESNNPTTRPEGEGAQKHSADL